MARPKSEDKRNAILAAAVRVIAAQGLSAPTALIAKEAGVSNGTLFVYFNTKAELLNALFVELKMEMAAVSADALPERDSARSQLAYMWRKGLHWATSHPDKHATIMHLSVSDDISEESREIGLRAMAQLDNLLDRCRQNGPMQDVPMPLVIALTSAVADAAVAFIISDPANAEAHNATSFDAVWRMLN